MRDVDGPSAQLDGASDSREEFRRFERDGWERASETYDAAMGAPITSRAAGPLLDAARVGPGSSVLDIACGPGYVAAAALARGAEATGVDVAEGMVARARRRCPGATFVQADAERLPFADMSFDAVVSNLGLPHFAAPESVVSELARVVRPGGRVALTTHAAPDRSALLGLVMRAAAEVGADAPAEIPAGLPITHYADATAFSDLLCGAGLVRVSVSEVAFEHRTDTEALWDALVRGSVRTAALIRSHTKARRARLRRAFERLAEEHAARGRLSIPVVFALATGERAAPDRNEEGSRLRSPCRARRPSRRSSPAAPSRSDGASPPGASRRGLRP